MRSEELDLKDIVAKAVRTKVAYPSEVKMATDDECTICVYVYDVPDNNIESIEDSLFDIGEKELAEHGYVLMPMVKDQETTARHYPQFKRYLCNVSIPALVEFYANLSPSWTSGHQQKHKENPQMALAA